MKHYDELILERYALSPALFRESGVREIRLHLDECPTCRNIYLFFNEFYDEFRYSLGESLPWVDEIIAGLTPVNTGTASPDNVHSSH